MNNPTNATMQLAVAQCYVKSQSVDLYIEPVDSTAEVTFDTVCHVLSVKRNTAVSCEFTVAEVANLAYIGYFTRVAKKNLKEIENSA